MSESQANKSDKTPWHLWTIAILGLLWSSMGAFDFVMTQTRNEDYMSHFTPDQLAFFYGFPIWVVIFWAIAVWGEVLGVLLLLMRKSLAVVVFLISFIALFITFIHNYILSNGMEVIGDTVNLIFTAVIFIIALGLYFYAKAMHKKGLLG